MYNAPNAFRSCNVRSFLLFPEDFFYGDEDNFSQDLMLTEQAIDYYHDTLKASPGIISLLEKRGIATQYIDEFSIGYSDRSIGEQLQPAKQLEGSHRRGALQRIGLLKSTGHELFRGAIFVPYRNIHGRIVGGYGRRTERQRREEIYHVYWNDDHVAFFNHDALSNHKSIILCKSAFDALTLLSSGFDNVVACMGLKGFNDIQKNALDNAWVTTVYIAFDNTMEGQKEACAVAESLQSICVDCRRVRLPRGHDINSFFLHNTNAKNRFQEYLSEAQPFVKDAFIDDVSSIKACMQIYIEQQRSFNKSERTIGNKCNQLDNFSVLLPATGFAVAQEITLSILEAYQEELAYQENCYTGEVISKTTQRERIEEVTRWLSFLEFRDGSVIPLRSKKRGYYIDKQARYQRAQ